MSSCVWVLGRSGMLGSSIAHVMDRQPDRWMLYQPLSSFSWEDPLLLERELQQAAEAFLQTSERASCDAWVVVWAAGTSVMRSEQGHLDREVAAFRALLTALAREWGKTGTPGTIFFASSAGALYGEGSVHTEESPLSPRSPYGEAKRVQEELLREWTAATPHVRAVIGRISTLIGESQNVSKPQGLISQLSRSIILRRTLPLYVPLDTARDYLYAPDCALLIASFLASLPQDFGKVVTKIFASEHSTTVAELLRILRDITKRSPRIILQQTPLTQRYTRTLRLRSVVPPHALPPTLFPTAIHRVHLHNMRLFAQGRLRPSTGPVLSVVEGLPPSLLRSFGGASRVARMRGQDGQR